MPDNAPSFTLRYEFAGELMRKKLAEVGFPMHLMENDGTARNGIEFKQSGPFEFSDIAYTLTWDYSIYMAPEEDARSYAVDLSFELAFSKGVVQHFGITMQDFYMNEATPAFTALVTLMGTEGITAHDVDNWFHSTQD